MALKMSRDFWKMQGLLWVFGPMIAGVVFWYTAFGIEAFQANNLEMVDLIGPFFSGLFWAISIWTSPFTGLYGMQIVVGPAVLGGTLFWLVSRLMFRKLGILSLSVLSLCSALTMPVLLCISFFVFNTTAAMTSFSDFYFYRPRDKALEDYAEWGFLDVFGPMYLAYVLCATGFFLGLICSPRGGVTLPALRH